MLKCPKFRAAVFAAEISLRAVGAAVLLARAVVLVVDKAGAAECLGHRAVRRGRPGVAGVAAASAFSASAWAIAPGIALRPALPLATAPAVVGGAWGAAALACAASGV